VSSKDCPAALPAPETAQDVRKALGQVMSDLMSRRLDARTASSMAYVGNVMLKAIELSDLEQRMEKLEELISNSDGVGDPRRQTSRHEQPQTTNPAR